MIERTIKSYAQEMQVHIAQYERECQSITLLLAQRPLSNLEYRALERLLQLSIEAAIGLAKHWGKKLNTVAANDAYQTFLLLRQYDKLTSDELITWRKIIGMRNALVHEYLEIDETLIKSIAEKSEYKTIFIFCRKVIDVLISNPTGKNNKAEEK